MTTRTITAVAACAALGLSGTALAHADLVATSPGKGRTVRAMPATVTLTFSGTLGRVDGVSITRAGRNHARSARIDPRNARRVRVATRPGGNGLYTVAWRVRTVDGHRIAGSFRFRVRR